MLNRLQRAISYFAIPLLASTVALGSHAAAKEGALRPWTIETSIGYTSYQPDCPTFSPNGRWFYCVTRRGEMATDTIAYELRVYATEDVEKWLRSGRRGFVSPRREVVTHSDKSDETFPAISSLQWDGDDAILYYLGFTRDNSQQVHALDIRTGAVRQLTSHVGGQIEYYIAQHNVVLYQVMDRWLPPKPAYPVQVEIRTPDLGGALRDIPANTFLLATRKVFVSNHEGFQHAVDVRLNLAENSPVSPDAGWVVAHDHLREKYVLIHLADGKVTDIAAVGKAALGERDPAHGDHKRISLYTFAEWSPDGSKIMLVNAVPLANEGSEGAILEYDMRSSSVRRVSSIAAPMGALNTARWSSNNTIEVAHWRGGEVVNVDQQVTLLQDANTPPQLVTKDAGKTFRITPPDPVLSKVRLAKQQPFRWHETDGSEHVGGLYLPTAFRPGHPVPLIIQPYRYWPNRFLPDGENSSVDAAQLLAASGFAVLKFEIPEGDTEGPQYVHRVDASVAALSKVGIVDPTKVGITGFSHAGFLVYYLITHPSQVLPAAAISSDGWTGSRYFYLEGEAITGDQVGAGHFLRQYEGKYGGSPWDVGSTWLREEPLANVHRVRSPFLFTHHGYQGVRPQFEAAEVERVGAFMRMHRPFDALYFPEGSHNLQRPRERMAMLQTTVDWFSFWILGREDPSPDKQEQYARWRQIKADWGLQQAWEAAGHPIGSKPDAGLLPPSAAAAKP